VVLLVGLSAAVLMAATEFSTIQSVRIGESSCGAAEQGVRDICETSGAEQHHYALLLLAVLTAFLAFGAAVGRSRPAAVALVGVGVAVLVIAFAIDHSSLDDTHGLDARYSGVTPETGGGYTLERIAGFLALAAGGLALIVASGGVALPSLPRRPARLRSGSRSRAGSDDDADQLELDEEDEREARRAEREAKRSTAEKPEDEAQ
jgi:hypothetical protein